MINKAKKYTAFFAATLNIVSSIFFYDYFKKEYTDPNNISSALGFWFALSAIMLWITYVALWAIASRKTK